MTGSDRLRALGLRMQEQMRKANRRPPPEAGIAQPAVAPRGPLPLAGGAEARLD